MFRLVVMVIRTCLVQPKLSHVLAMFLSSDDSSGMLEFPFNLCASQLITSLRENGLMW